MSTSKLSVFANAFYVATTDVRCWHCKQTTPAYGFLLPDGHRVGNLEPSGFQAARTDFMGFPFYIEDLDDSVAGQMAIIAPTYTLTGGSGDQPAYWRNHCVHCGKPQGDFYLYEETTPFSPLDTRRAPAVRLKVMLSAFRGTCNAFMPAGHLRRHLALLLE